MAALEQDKSPLLRALVEVTIDVFLLSVRPSSW